MGVQRAADSASSVVAAIVVIADRSIWAQTTASYLASEGFLVLVDPTGDSAFDQRARSADAAIIDLSLAARPATEVCAAWRHRSSAPIFAMAGARDEATVLAAYTAGADHVAPIDITPRLFLARLRSMLRRAPVRRDGSVSSAAEALPVLLDADHMVALIQSTRVPLTKQEFEFLQLLIGRAGRVVERRELAASVDAGSSHQRAIDFFVRRLREKLESVDGQRRITTVRGVGFRFEVGTHAGTGVPT